MKLGISSIIPMTNVQLKLIHVSPCEFYKQVFLRSADYYTHMILKHDVKKVNDLTCEEIEKLHLQNLSNFLKLFLNTLLHFEMPL